ncbi:MAG: thiamine phosphate synthase [Actinobacteria bacterium]|nr:thiamine phosphate synthase [Actinomycetota bacterium]MBW3647166.1 thiamine phosphate synthase [Actinomycetota bacterium]
MVTSIRDRLARARLYLCTGARPDLAEFLDAVLSGGVDVVQLRQKGLEAKQEIALCEVVAAAASRHGALWSVNDRADVAYATRPDVLHLGQDDLPVGVARALLGEQMLVGRSCHDEAQVAAAAEQPGVDYFCVGPTWPTPTKPGRVAPGVALLRYATALRTERPWFAIGGIDAGNLDEVLATGARRVVVVRALTEAVDPYAAAVGLAGRLAAADRPESA